MIEQRVRVRSGSLSFGLFVSCDMVYLISDIECVTTIRARVHCRNTIAYRTECYLFCRVLIFNQNSNRMNESWASYKS